MAESALTGRFANITGLTQTQADQRRADGEVPEGLAFEKVRISTILRKYLWTPFNADLLGLTIVLLLIGRPLDDFLSAAAILLAISITVLQELWAQKQLERITVEGLPRFGVNASAHNDNYHHCAIARNLKNNVSPEHKRRTAIFTMIVW